MKCKECECAKHPEWKMVNCLLYGIPIDGNHDGCKYGRPRDEQIRKPEDHPGRSNV